VDQALRQRGGAVADPDDADVDAHGYHRSSPPKDGDPRLQQVLGEHAPAIFDPAFLQQLVA